MAAQLPDGDLRTRCTELAHRAETGVVADALLPTLEATLELALQRRPLAQPVLTGVFARTPRGEELAAATREVNAALHSIKGQRLEQVRLTSGPRRYALTLETERVRLQLVLDDAGPRIESAEVG